jgi:hypothetical protein
MSGFYFGDNALHDMVIDNNNVWTAIGEGIIGRSSDSGNTWIQLFTYWNWPTQWALYLWDIEVSPSDNNKLYVTGDNSAVTRVPLLYSQNNGLTWDTLSTMAAVSPPKMKCLTVKNTTSGDKVFLGGRGVYSYQNIPTSMNTGEQKETFFIFPNPLSDKLFVDNLFGRGEITIYSTEGEKVLQSIITNLKYETDVRNLPPGIYIVKIQAGEKVVVKKMVKM